MLTHSSYLTATSSCRICTCFPFHPETEKLLRTPRTLYSLKVIIAQAAVFVKRKRISHKNGKAGRICRIDPSCMYEYIIEAGGKTDEAGNFVFADGFIVHVFNLCACGVKADDQIRSGADD